MQPVPWNRWRIPLADPCRWTRWACLLLLRRLMSPMNFPGALTSPGARRSSVGRGVRGFVISVCLCREQRQRSPLSHFPERADEKREQLEELSPIAGLCLCARWRTRTALLRGTNEDGRWCPCRLVARSSTSVIQSAVIFSMFRMIRRAYCFYS